MCSYILLQGEDLLITLIIVILLVTMFAFLAMFYCIQHEVKADFKSALCRLCHSMQESLSCRLAIIWIIIYYLFFHYLLTVNSVRDGTWRDLALRDGKWQGLRSREDGAWDSPSFTDAYVVDEEYAVDGGVRCGGFGS